MKFSLILEWIPKIIAFTNAINTAIPVAKQGAQKLKLLLGTIGLYIDLFTKFGEDTKPKILKFVDGFVELYVKVKKKVDGIF